MADWLKIVIGTLTGFVVGLVAEPIKTWIAAKLKERMIRKAPYASMADLYGFFSRTSEEQHPCIRLDLHLDMFNHYYTTEKTAFYRLREAHFIGSFFHQVRGISDALSAKQDRECEDRRLALIRTVQNAIQSEALNHKLISRLCAKGPSWNLATQK